MKAVLDLPMDIVMTITPVSKLVADAEQHIEAWTVDQVKARLTDDAVQLVDIRDVRELWREGTIPGAFHAPRGLLEFWVDPKSPYAKDIFQQHKTFVLFCGSGWRSALAAKALTDMGLENVAHIKGGYTAWSESGGDTVAVTPKT